MVEAGCLTSSFCLATTFLSLFSLSFVRPNKLVQLFARSISIADSNTIIFIKSVIISVYNTVVLKIIKGNLNRPTLQVSIMRHYKRKYTLLVLYVL